MVLPDLVVQHRPDMRTAMGLPAEPGPGERRKGMAALGGHQPGRHNKPQRLDTQSLLEGLCVPSRSDAGTKAEGKRPPPHRPPIERKRSPWDAIERVRILAAYAEAAGELGADISGLLASLEGGADRQRITVLTGSNGVSLGELTGSGAYPGAFAWHELLLERTLHVPLAIASSTGGEAAVYDEPVELVDILPTLLGVAGAVTPAGIAGEDLLASSIGEDPPSAYAEFGDMLAVRQGPLMLTLRARLHNSTSLDPVLTEKLLCPGQEGARLHDVVADPMQEHDLRRERSEDAERLEQRMVAYRTGLGAPPADRVDIDSLWQLRLTPAEGYW
jgi:arylsulfatase A-like enzyme